MTVERDFLLDSRKRHPVGLVGRSRDVGRFRAERGCEHGHDGGRSHDYIIPYRKVGGNGRRGFGIIWA